MRAVQKTLHVDRDHPVPLLERRVDRRAEQHHAGVVDQRVEAAELGDRPLHQDLGLLLRGHVGLDRERLAATVGDRCGQLIEPIRAARSDRDRGALLGERHRGRFADPARRAGHQRDRPL